MEGRGEVVVMSLVLARVVISLYFHGLFCELAGLVFLSLAALLVESAASSNGLELFNPRLGTSPGVYMSALCVPIVLVARLVQCVRTSSTLANSGDCENFRLEFWSAFACSVALLVFILHTLDRYKYFTCISHGQGKLRASFKLVTYHTTVAVVIASLATLLPIKLASVLFHFIGSTLLFEYEVRVFPHCASLGEAMLVANGLAVYIANALACTLAKISMKAASQFYTISSSKDTISAILQGTLIGLSCVPELYKTLGKVSSGMLVYLCIKPTKAKTSTERICNAAAFYLALLLALVVLTMGWLYFVHGLKESLVMWIIAFVLDDTQRLVLCVYWVGVLCTSVLPFYMSKNTKYKRIMVRKVFHLMVVIMFIPALLVQQVFLKLALSVAFVGFLVVEMIRVWRIPPFGEVVHSFMTAFTDSRDSNILIISHFSLLLGCALPLWLTNSQNDRSLAPFAGVLSLGIGDTMASVIGHNYGSCRLSSSSSKCCQVGMNLSSLPL